MSLAENIRKLRKARGLTQAQLAHRCGITEFYISRLEIQERNSPRFLTGCERRKLFRK